MVRFLRAEAVRERGVTLVELVVTLAVSTLITTGVLVLWQQSQKAYMQGAEAADIQQNLRVGMDRMVRVIQAAGVNPKNKPFAGAAPNDPAFVAFREAGPNCLRLYADLNGDADVQDTDENIAFTWTGTAGDALMQESGVAAGGADAGQVWTSASTGAQELALGLVPNPNGDSVFRYFTGPNALLGSNVEMVPTPGAGCGGLNAVNRAQIGRILITLTAQATVGGETFRKMLISEVRPRNVP